MMNRFLATWYVQLLAGVVSATIAYGFGSWAVDSGKIMAYVLALVFLIFSINRLAAGVKTIFGK